MITKPNYADAPAYCHPFFDLVAGEDLLLELQQSKEMTLDLMRQITPAQENLAYAVGKWTIKEVFRHIVECERVYTYRALRFSRFDATELGGFDVDGYIKNVSASLYSLQNLVREYEAVRNATIALFETMSDEMLDFKGTANKVSFTARGLGYMAVGHNLHHCRVVQARYL